MKEGDFYPKKVDFFGAPLLYNRFARALPPDPPLHHATPLTRCISKPLVCLFRSDSVGFGYFWSLDAFFDWVTPLSFDLLYVRPIAWASGVFFERFQSAKHEKVPGRGKGLNVM